MMDELSKRLGKSPEDQLVRNAIAEVRPICARAAAKVEEITLEPEEEEDDEDEAEPAAGGAP
jgi:hypothetical protein